MSEMRAVLQTHIGGLDVLEESGIERPRPPRRDEVLVKVAACGVCFHDVLVRNGTYRKYVELPLIPGHEISGVVEAVGEEVMRISVGQHVASTNRETCGQCGLCRTGVESLCERQRFLGHNTTGGYTEYALIRENALIGVPTSIPLEQAAVMFCAVATELHAIRDVGRARPGDTVVVTGAGGGLGIHGVQVAKVCGARVIGVTTTEAKADAIRRAGADEVVVVAREELFAPRLLELAPGGVDVVCDNVGEPVFKSCFRALAVGGRYVFVGQINDRPISVNPAWLVLRNTELKGSHSASRVELEQVVDLVASDRIRPVVEVIPLSQAREAQRRVEAGTATGRLVLVP